VRYALEAVRRRPGRAAMTSLGIGLAVGLVVVLLAISAGIQTSSTTLATQSGVDLLATSANASAVLSGALPPISGAHALAREIPANDSNVVVASPWLIGDLVFGNATLYDRVNASDIPGGWSTTGAGTVGWIPDDNSGIEVPPLYNGSGFTAPGDPHYANGSFTGPETHEIVLDQGMAEVLGVGIGGYVWASPVAPPSHAALRGWYANATPFRVVGISGPFWLVPSALLAFVYLSEMQALIGGGTPSTDYASLLLIHLGDASDAGTDQLRIEARYPQLTVLTLQDILGAIQHVENLYQTFGILVGAIGVVVAVLFATTVLQMSVDDRSRELALLRAIGYSRARVGGFVLEESLLLAGIGLGIGLAVAFVGTYLLNLVLLSLVPGLPSSFSFVSFNTAVIGSGVGLVLVVGLVAAIAPAARAMQLPVAEELRAP
jgi:putative ABC transport system permease protein